MTGRPQLSPEFRDFLVEAKTHGYASEAVERRVMGSGANEITFEDGDWLYTDNFVGGLPFAGYEHVSARHPEDPEQWLPVWGMSYHGLIINGRITNLRLAELLSDVLSKPDKRLPVRGPTKHFLNDAMGSYDLKGEGGLEAFAVHETISPSSKYVLYRAEFLGGLVNRNRELEALKPKWLA